MKKQSYIYSSIAVVILFAGAAVFYSPSEPASTRLAPIQKGVCWVGGRSVVTDKEIMAAKKCGVTWISQTPFGWQQDKRSPIIQFDTLGDHGYWGETEEGISVTTRLAKKQGIHSMLKPHLWIKNSWPGEVDMNSEQDWKTWFEHYRRFILHHAQIAEQNGIEILCIGTELSFASKHEDEWRALIKMIRTRYAGQLTYAANFDGEYEHITFWDALDFIGVQGYFPLADQENAPVESMVKEWKKYLAALEAISRKFEKPVLFTEIGYRSTSDAAIHPWVWPQHLESQKASNEMQANCYEAFFRATWNKSWLAGVYFWKWYPHGRSRMAEIDFTPQGKPAEQVMAYWYNRP